jgi:hypothetical protein
MDVPPGEVYSTESLDLASYFLGVGGLAFLGFEALSPGRHIFFIHDPEGRAPGYAKEFINSPYALALDQRKRLITITRAGSNKTREIGTARGR